MFLFLFLFFTNVVASGNDSFQEKGGLLVVSI